MATIYSKIYWKYTIIVVYIYFDFWIYEKYSDYICVSVFISCPANESNRIILYTGVYRIIRFDLSAI